MKNSFALYAHSDGFNFYDFYKFYNFHKIKNNEKDIIINRICRRGVDYHVVLRLPRPDVAVGNEQHNGVQFYLLHRIAR